MSYSFNIKAAGKTLAKAAVARELDKVVETQPEHVVDRKSAGAAADAFIDALVDDPTMDVQVAMHGSVGWRAKDAFTSASVGVSAYLVPRE